MEKGGLLKCIIISTTLFFATHSYANTISTLLKLPPGIHLSEDFSSNILTILQTLRPGQSMYYPYQGHNYKIYLTKEGTLHIENENGERKQLDKLKIAFDRRVKVLYPVLSKEDKTTIDGARAGIFIKDVDEVRITKNNIEFEITYKSEKYFCSIPIQYFHQILQNLEQPSVTLNDTAIAEIYGETQFRLDEETKELYEQIKGYLKGLIIVIK